MANVTSNAVSKRVANELLDAFPMGVILLNGTSRVLATNQPAARILERADGLALEGRRLRAADPEEAESLRELVQQTASNGATDPADGSNARRLSRPSGRRALQILVQRMGRNGAGEPGGHPPVALFVTDPDERVEIPVERLRRLYGLTPSEGRIAARLTAGLRPEEVALELGVQVNTIRMHLKRIFSKTGTGRQSELVGLLLRSPARLTRA